MITGLKCQIYKNNEIFINDYTYWAAIYNSYHTRIDKLIKYDNNNGTEWQEALTCAIESLNKFTVEDLVNFIDNYNNDYETKIGGIFNV